MAQTNNTKLYPVDTNPELSDLLFGSVSKNFLISSVLDLINAQNLIQFEFADGANAEITRYSTGKFLTNNNSLDPLTFTKFYFNKSNSKPLDLSPLFGKLALTTNLVLRIEKQDNSNSFFEFNISSIENHTDYFTFNVAPSFYLGLLENNKKYNITFNIKTSIPQENRIFNETPSGVLNGINATFTSINNFIPETVTVFLNGIFQRIVFDFNTVGNNTIILTSSPGATENILINYTKS